VVASKNLAYPFPVESGNILSFDLFWAFSLASVGVGAAAEAEFVHLAHHFLYTFAGFYLTLWQKSKMAYFCTYEEHGTGVFACSYTGSAANAFGGVHGHIGTSFGNGYAIGVWHTSCSYADIAARLDYFVKSATVHNEVSDYRKWFGPPWFNPYLVAVIELAHVELAGGDTVVVAMWTAIDIKSAHAADSFATVVVKAYGMGYVVVDKLLVEYVKHFKERAVG
jgi:hypothetical protein